jgi:glycosyltransferase involved in cell wall biosynthesis
MSRSPSENSARWTTLPVVSVIMPAYNVALYLEEAARSALRQTYASLELIIIDDGSTDSTADVAAAIARADVRVRVIAQPNKGLAAARNTGLQAARGEFFALLDSDDLWESRFLERQMTTFEAHPQVDLVTGNGRYLGGACHGAAVRPFPDPRPPLTLNTIITDEEAVFVMTVFRRRVYETIGGFDDTLRTNEDFDYWLRAALAGFRFARNPEPLAWYRRRDDSLSADAPRMLAGALRVCNKARALFADRPERELLERQIAYYEAELDAAVARQALAAGNRAEAARALASLNARRPTVRTAVAALMARRAAPILASLYRLKRRRQPPRSRIGRPIVPSGPREVTGQ